MYYPKTAVPNDAQEALATLHAFPETQALLQYNERKCTNPAPIFYSLCAIMRMVNPHSGVLMGKDRHKALAGYMWHERYGCRPERMFKSFVEPLERLGLVAVEHGTQYGSTKNTRLTCVKPTDKWLKVLNTLGCPAVVLRKTRHKDMDAEVMGCPDGMQDVLHHMEEEVYALRKGMAAMDVRFEGEPLRTDLYRVFNDMDTSIPFTHGGRFYYQGRSHQALLRGERKCVTINGKRVVDVDFASAFARMGCALKGLHRDSCPEPFGYVPKWLDGEDPKIARMICKRMVNTGMQCRNYWEWIGAMEAWVAGELATDAYGIPMETAVVRYTRERLPCMQSASALEIIMAANVDWIDYCEGYLDNYGYMTPLLGMGRIGMEVVRAESDIALASMLEMCGLGLPYLCEHDALITTEDNAYILADIMGRNFMRRFPETGWHVPIKLTFHDGQEVLYDEKEHLKYAMTASR